MYADSSAKGTIGGSGMASRAVTIYGEVTGSALRQILDEAAAAIEHRGRHWASAMTQISDALDSHLANADEALKPAFTLSNRGRLQGVGGADRAGALLDAERTAIRSKLAEFREGWTAPRPKSGSNATQRLTLLLC